MAEEVEEWAKRLCENHDIWHAKCESCDLVISILRAYAAEQVAQARAEEREACAKIANNYNPATQTDVSGRLLWPTNDEYAGVMRAGAVIAAKEIATAIRAGE